MTDFHVYILEHDTFNLDQHKLEEDLTEEEITGMNLNGLREPAYTVRRSREPHSEIEEIIEELEES